MRLAICGILAAFTLVLGACSSSDGPTVNYMPPAGGPNAGAGAPGGGSGGSSGAPTTTAGTGGDAVTAGTGGTGPSAGSGGTSGGSTAGTSGGGGASGGGSTDLFKPKASPGCGKDPATAAVTGGTLRKGNWASADLTIPIKGTRLGDITRVYNVWLPANYDPMKAYKVYYQGPGCGGGPTNVYDFPNASGQAANFDGIRVGLKFHPNAHQGSCFDDKQGNTSIEWPTFKAINKLLKDNLCFDEHRIFATGVSSGSWLSNELACISGTPPGQPQSISDVQENTIRAIGVTTGGLPQGAEVPTCTQTPFAGIWIHDLNDVADNPYAGSQRAVERAILVNKCLVNGQPTKFTERDPWPVTGVTRQICEKLRGCPAEYPLIMCSSTGQGHGDQGDLAPKAYLQLLTSLNP